MITTDYKIDGQQVDIELLDDGYKIYKGGTVWIHQYEPFIPDKTKSYEENAIQQIEEIIASFENAQNEQDEITEMQLAITELYEMMLGGTE